jgi:hypothetical protein
MIGFSGAYGETTHHGNNLSPCKGIRSASRILRQRVGDQFAASEGAIGRHCEHDVLLAVVHVSHRRSRLLSGHIDLGGNIRAGNLVISTQQGDLPPFGVGMDSPSPAMRSVLVARTPMRVRPGCPSRGRSSPLRAGLFLISSGVEEWVCQRMSPVFMSYAAILSYGGLISGNPSTFVPPRPPPNAPSIPFRNALGMPRTNPQFQRGCTALQNSRKLRCGTSVAS